MRIFQQFFLLAGLLLLGTSAAQAVPAADPLSVGFIHPPFEAKPQIWWHWINNNETQEGIKADLEAMHRVGFGGAVIFNLQADTPLGNVPFNGPKWHALVKYAMTKARALGMTINMENTAGWSSSGGPWITPDNAMKMVTWSETEAIGPSEFQAVLPVPDQRNGFYRDIAVLAFPTPAAKGTGIPQLRAKAAFEVGDVSQKTTAATDTVVDPAQIRVLPVVLAADGTWGWHVPAGHWILMRLGYTLTGAMVHPTTDDQGGLECDKLNPRGADAAFSGMLAGVIQDVGPLAGTTFNGVTVDSYEQGCQNWSENFRTEFQKRRGYDPLPDMVVFSNRVVGSGDATDRFLWDFRKTIADLYAENYYGRMAALVHAHGLQFYDEPYGDSWFDRGPCGGVADVPMSEFWSDPLYPLPQQISSVAHTYGKAISGAESFTSVGADDWTTDPYMLKAVGDGAYCYGVNRVTVHSYVQQPFLGGGTGITNGAIGRHYNRHTTWWNQSAAWVQYMTRSQFLLQQGKPVMDVLFWSGDSSSGELPALDRGRYDFDLCDQNVLLHRITVRNGRLVLPDGMSYRLLNLPSSTTMTLAVLQKLRALVVAGATVVGPKPTASPSLQNYPVCDTQVQQLAGQLWGPCNGTTVTAHRVGRGRVFWAPLPKVLTALGLAPDFTYRAVTGAKFLYIHRRTADAEIYLVSNTSFLPTDAVCTFRVAGKQPFLWHADTGRQEAAPVYTTQSGCTTLPLHFDSAGSVFVVFRNAAGHLPHLAGAVRVPAASDGAVAAQVVIQHAVYAAQDGAGSVDVTALLQRKYQGGVLSLDVTNDALGQDPAFGHVKQLKVDYLYNGTPHQQTVTENGNLTICPPAVLDHPADVLVEAGANGLRLQAWQGGIYRFTTSPGHTYTKIVASPAAQDLSAHWDVHFPPNLGAPPAIVLPRLQPLNEHREPGVKYFSGTATYTRDFTIAPYALAHSRKFFLNLGDVKNLAEVTLNGKNLGILWKPPFFMDVSSVVHPGVNHLCVAVTNLWANRLIGDEFLPPDSDSHPDVWLGIPGRTLTSWPAWMVAGKPSPTGRIATGSWSDYTQTSPLLPSGLIGPVVLLPVVCLPLPEH